MPQSPQITHATWESKWEGGSSSSSGPGTRAARKVSNLWLWGLQGLSSTFCCSTLICHPPGVLEVLQDFLSWVLVLTQGVGEGLHESLTDLIRVWGGLNPLWNWIYINMRPTVAAHTGSVHVSLSWQRLQWQQSAVKDLPFRSCQQTSSLKHTPSRPWISCSASVLSLNGCCFRCCTVAGSAGSYAQKGCHNYFRINLGLISVLDMLTFFISTLLQKSFAGGYLILWRLLAGSTNRFSRPEAADVYLDKQDTASPAEYMEPWMSWSKTHNISELPCGWWNLVQQNPLRTELNFVARM